MLRRVNHSDIGPVYVAKLCSYCSHCRKLSDGLFLEVCEEISKLYPTIEFSNMIIDNCAMQVRIARDREPVPGWVSMQNDPHTGLVLYWALPAKRRTISMSCLLKTCTTSRRKVLDFELGHKHSDC